MTRNRDVFIPLDDRARISNRRSNAIFVSVHYNYGGRSGASGVEIFYKSPVSRAIAQNILREMNAIPGTASRGVKTADFRVLRKNRFPAVLVECGFLTSPSEGRRCAQPEYREALADAIVRGIRNQREGR
jgi:N-acetylmuramoyl-L-alanine amidase